MSDFRVGDHVRLVFEGEVTRVWADDYPDDAGLDIDRETFDGTQISKAKVEKVEPPVEVFKPGDHLRRKGALRYEITLADNGYLLHYTSGSVDYVKYDGPEHRKFFNSENFEKVNLS